MPRYQNDRKVRRLTDETKAQMKRMPDDAAMVIGMAVAAALIGRSGVYVAPSNYGQGIRIKFYANDEVSEGSWVIDDELPDEMQYAVDEGVSLEAGKHFERLLAAWRAERRSEPRERPIPSRRSTQGVSVDPGASEGP